MYLRKSDLDLNAASGYPWLSPVSPDIRMYIFCIVVIGSSPAGFTVKRVIRLFGFLDLLGYVGLCDDIRHVDPALLEEF